METKMQTDTGTGVAEREKKISVCLFLMIISCSSYKVGLADWEEIRFKFFVFMATGIWTLLQSLLVLLFFCKSIKMENRWNLSVFSVLPGTSLLASTNQSTFSLHQLYNQPHWILFTGVRLCLPWVRHCFCTVASCRHLSFLRIWTSWLLCNLSFQCFKIIMIFFTLLQYMDVNGTLSSSSHCWVISSLILMKHH